MQIKWIASLVKSISIGGENPGTSGTQQNISINITESLSTHTSAKSNTSLQKSPKDIIPIPKISGITKHVSKNRGKTAI